ncbi:hypothetical protein PMZ80_008629 [Knufia obscura]|uniref:Uncharacterized protein n=2 Tax=Knufia TaxID=430999 RepID=A0AAN8I706_9EURO|nr:hypothetical protein PMZ80_008629 [Knufia obscura]KAK5952085.1 hypothetical protein OHC33_006972 [Knufia fluminis]
MHDDDPETLERLLRWIYLLKYPSLAQNQQQTAWTKDLMLYMMADKYGLVALMEATRRALLETAAQHARQPNQLIESIEDFVELMQMLYVDLPDRDDLVTLRGELLTTLAPVVAKHMRNVEVLEDLMTSIPGFGVALVESLACLNQDSRRPSSSSDSLSVGSGGSDVISANGSPRYVKPYIPLNEDSEDEME